MIEQSILDSPKKIKEIDKSDMLTFIDELPEMMLKAREISKAVKLPTLKKTEKIVIAGMGGSAISGDITSTLLSYEIEIPIFTYRTYDLPKAVGKETLLFAISYSGNTEETLSILKGSPTSQIIAITSGGQLKKLAEEKGIPLILIPYGIPPRAALGYLLTPVLIILERLGLAQKLKEQIEETVNLLAKLKANYLVTTPEKANPPKKLAQKLYKKIPIIFATCGTTEAAGLRWKTQFSENSKMTALLNLFPELNHNEIVNLGELKKGEHSFSLVILRDKEDHKQVKKRIEITKKLLQDKIEITEVWAQGQSRLARLMSLIYFGDYLSVYLALLNGTDPTPVRIIENLKKELA